MADNILFSVIVPVYNADKYLEKCINSILAQTYTEFELIMVDDGSTDKSAQILDKYAEKDKRIVTEHKENGGIGSAYIVGTGMAKGDYLVFVDSDDFIEREMLQKLYSVIEETSADIVHFGLRMEDEQGQCLWTEIPPIVQLEGKEILEAYFTRLTSPSLACRTFRRFLFDSVEFIPQSTGIDEATIIQVLAKCQKYVSIETVFYHVYVRGGSISRSAYSSTRIEQNIWLYHYMLKFAKQNIPESLRYIELKYIKLLMGMYRACDRDTLKQKKKELLKEFRTHYANLWKSKELKQDTFHFQLGAKLFRYAPGLYREIKKNG